MFRDDDEWRELKGDKRKRQTGSEVVKGSKRVTPITRTKESIVDIPWDLLAPRFRENLPLIQTQGCASLTLSTDRLILRPCKPEDLVGIQRIKTEPLVQKTQLYGSPSNEDCKVFLNRYIRSSIPRLAVGSGQYRDEYVFAITLKDPLSININPPSQIKLSSCIKSAEGYIGNVGLSLRTKRRSSVLFPQPGRIYRHPTLEETSAAGLSGDMYYELHPQLWGQGLMSEAFTEVLRFAIEEVGCETIRCNPMTTNRASIKLCERNGMEFKGSNKDNDYRKPQAVYEITREEWTRLNRPEGIINSPFEGRRVCRWCLNFHLPEPEIWCEKCEWAEYCSRECQHADRIRRGGHREECNNSRS